MSKRAHKKAIAIRDSRRSDFDAIPITRRQGRKRPGSLNPRKTGAVRTNPRRRRK